MVKAVSFTNRQRLIEVFLRAVRLRFTRSRCVALSWLASLASVHLRPSNCSHFANQSLSPVLELLAAEEEEDVHKALSAALSQLLPLLGKYWELAKLAGLLDILLPKVVGGTDARSRFVAASLCSICMAPPSAALADASTSSLHHNMCLGRGNRVGPSQRRGSSRGTRKKAF